MIVRRSDAEWDGGLRDGHGRVALGSGAFAGPYSFRSRTEGGAETNPEELIAAAHAGCFTMALVAGLSGKGYVPGHVRTTAKVRLDQDGPSFTIGLIELETEADVAGIDPEEFRRVAEQMKASCPVSKALAGTTITLTATLVGRS